MYDAFNTLECMRSMARHFNVSPLERLISSLSGMFRYSLSADFLSTLEQEVSHVQNYMDIMQARSARGYALRIDADGEALRSHLLAMCLQPLVENCVLHAFETCERRPVIRISGMLVREGENSMLSVSVTDNGDGIDAASLTQLNQVLREPDALARHESIALPNIAQRIRLTYGEAGRIHVDSKPGHYTKVTLHFPLISAVEPPVVGEMLQQMHPYDVETSG